MRRKRSKMSTVLVLMMIVGLLVAGCSSNTNTPSNNNVATPTPKSSEKVAEEGTVKDEELKPVKLVWYIRSAEPANMASVMEKANAIISEKINATLEFKFINPGDYEQKMQLVMSSGEEYDISFTASWTNNYFNNVSKGAYAPIDDILANYPDLQNMFQKEVWDAVKVDGKTYAIPNNQIMGDQPGLWFKKDLVEKYNIDINNVKSLEDLTPIFQTIKDGEPGVSAIRDGIPGSFMEYVPQLEGKLPLGYALDTETWKVYFQADQMTNQFKLMREWYEKDFFPQDVATIKDEIALFKTGKVFSRYNRIKPGIDADLKKTYGYDVVSVPTGPAIISKAAVTSTLNAVSATSKNPDRAVMLINLIDTNKELFNILKFGIEGQDYTKVSDNRIEPIAEKYSVPGWLFGNEFNSFIVPGQDDDVWEQTKVLNDTATIDPSISFTFNRENVENEIAQLSAITTEYELIVKSGLDDVDKIMKAMMDKRKAAGHDKVLAELQTQVDEWRKTQ